MTVTQPNEVAYELTNTIISLQETIRNVRQKLSKNQQDLVFDASQPVCSSPSDTATITNTYQIGHLLDSTSATAILSLAKPTSEHQEELNALEKKVTVLQDTLQTRHQWHPPPTSTPIPCSTDYLDLSDLSTAVALISDVVQYSNPSSQLTPQTAFAAKHWTWDPLWREFFASDDSGVTGVKTSTYLSRWLFDPRTEIWRHANMADSGLLPDEAQMRLGSWEDWRWDVGCGEWGLDVSSELEEEARKEGARLCVFASRWQERGGVWMYVGARGG